MYIEVMIFSWAVKQRRLEYKQSVIMKKKGTKFKPFSRTYNLHPMEENQKSSHAKCPTNLVANGSLPTPNSMVRLIVISTRTLLCSLLHLFHATVCRYRRVAVIRRESLLNAFIMVTLAQTLIRQSVIASGPMSDQQHHHYHHQLNRSMAEMQPESAKQNAHSDWPLSRGGELLLDMEGEDRISGNDDGQLVESQGGQTSATNAVRTSKQLKKLLARPRQILSSFVPYTLSKQLVLRRPNNLMMTMNLTKRIHDKLQSPSGSISNKPQQASSRHQFPVSQHQRSQMHDHRPQVVPTNLKVRLDRPHSNNGGYLALHQVKPMFVQQPHSHPAMINQQHRNLESTRQVMANGRMLMVDKVPMVMHHENHQHRLPSMIEHRPATAEEGDADDDVVTEEELSQEGQEGGGLGQQDQLVQFDQLIRDEFETRLNLNEQMINKHRQDTNGTGRHRTPYNWRPAAVSSSHQDHRHFLMGPANDTTSDHARKLQQQHYLQSATETKRLNLPAPHAGEQPFVPTALETIAHLTMNNGSSSGRGNFNYHHNLQLPVAGVEQAARVAPTNDSRFPPPSNYFNTKVPSSRLVQHQQHRASDKANKLSTNKFAGSSVGESTAGSYTNTIRNQQPGEDYNNNNFYLQTPRIEHKPASTQQRIDNSIADHRPTNGRHLSTLLLNSSSGSSAEDGDEDADADGGNGSGVKKPADNLYQRLADSHIDQIISPMTTLTSSQNPSPSATNQRQRKGTLARQQHLSAEQVSNENESENDDDDDNGSSGNEALSETLLRLHETKTRIRQLQAELNATGPMLLHSAMRPAPSQVHLNLDRNHTQDDDSFDDEQRRDGWFQLWSPTGSAVSRGNDQVRQLNSSATGGLLIRAHNSLNLPLGMYHAGNPLTAPARLVASAFGNAAKGATTPSRGRQPVLVRTQAGWLISADQVQTSPPVLLASTLLVDGHHHQQQQQQQYQEQRPAVQQAVDGEGDDDADEKAIMNGKQLSGTKLLPASSSPPNGQPNNLTLSGYKQLRLNHRPKGLKTTTSGNNGTTMQPSRHTTDNTLPTLVGAGHSRENQTSAEMTTTLTGSRNSNQLQVSIGDNGGESAAITVDLVDNGKSSSGAREKWDADRRNRLKDQALHAANLTNVGLKPLKFEPIQQSTDLSLVTSTRHQPLATQTPQLQPASQREWLLAVAEPGGGGGVQQQQRKLNSTATLAGGKQWSAMIGFEPQQGGKGTSGSDRRRADSDKSSESGPVGFLDRLLSKLAGSFGSASSDQQSQNYSASRATKTGARQTLAETMSHSDNATANEYQFNSKLTTEKVLHTFIAFSCSLAILCLVVVVATVRCQMRRRKRASSSSSSSSSAGLATNRCDEPPKQQYQSRGLDAWRRLSGLSKSAKKVSNTAGDRYTPRDKLILDGTMRNISLLARHLTPSSSRAAGGQQQPSATLVKMPQPTLNSSCCHCVSCSESWLFRSDSQDDQDNNNGPRNICSSGFYHPAPRGKLPFGTASSVNKLLTPMRSANSDTVARRQRARHPIGGTRLKMMSAIEERSTTSPSPTPHDAILLLADDQNGRSPNEIAAGDCTCNRYQCDEELCGAPSACCRQQQHGCQLAAGDQQVVGQRQVGDDLPNNEPCSCNVEHHSCCHCIIDEGESVVAAAEQQKQRREQLISSKQVNNSNLPPAPQPAANGFDSINVNEQVSGGGGSSSSSRNERVATTSAKNSVAANCETSAVGSADEQHRGSGTSANANANHRKTPSGEKEVESKCKEAPIKTKSNSRLLLLHPLVQRLRDRNGSADRSAAEKSGGRETVVKGLSPAAGG